MSNPASAGVHTGSPSGGQFTATARSEGAPFDRDDDTSPVPITALGLADGDSLHLTDFDLGDDVFATVEVHRSGERYTAIGTVPVDLYGEDARGGPDSDEVRDAAARFLTERELDFNAFLADRNGGALQPDITDSEETAVAFSIDLDPAADTSGDILDKLRTETRAQSLRNDLDDDSDRGFYRALHAALD